MKIPLFFLTILLTTFSAMAQDITGLWNGSLKTQGIELRLVFNVIRTNQGLVSTMDSPDQGAKGIPVTKTTWENLHIKFEITNPRIEYSGELKGNEIVGTFKQSGLEFPMTLSRKAVEKVIIRRPQEPVKPYPYNTEEITFSNKKANIILSGTLTLPKKEGLFPVVILITGSGTQNRDEEILGHKPFLIIADFLTRNGVAVLRYDDRGFGQSSEKVNLATTADFATDVESAIEYLKTRKDMNHKKIGLIGHSEGGIIAPMVAARSKDVSFIVLLAGTGMQGSQLLLHQQELIAKVAGISDEEITQSKALNTQLFEMVVQSKDTQQLKIDLTNQLNNIFTHDTAVTIPDGMSREEFITVQVETVTAPWMQYFLKYNPATALQKVKCPVLAVNGEKDLQVPPKENLNAIKSALLEGRNQKVTIIEFPNLNHLFQECTTGSPSEYATIEQTFSPTALEEITKWIKSQVK